MAKKSIPLFIAVILLLLLVVACGPAVTKFGFTVATNAGGSLAADLLLKGFGISEANATVTPSSADTKTVYLGSGPDERSQQFNVQEFVRAHNIEDIDDVRQVRAAMYEALMQCTRKILAENTAGPAMYRERSECLASANGYSSNDIALIGHAFR